MPNSVKYNIKQRGFAHILLVLTSTILIFLTAGFLWANIKNGHLRFNNIPFEKLLSENEPKEYTRNPSVTNSLVSCQGNNFLTVSPIDLDKLDRIVPLGLIHPPGHALPMDHMLLSVPSDGRVKVDVKAPGTVHIFGVRQVTYKRDGAVEGKIYSIAFTPCKELTFYFEAMSTLSDSLQKIIQPQKCEPNSQKEGRREFEFCEYLVDFFVKGGEIIGTAGGVDSISKSLDWGSYDIRIAKLPFIGRGDEGPNKAVFYTTCPLDYYSSPLKDQLYDKLTRKVEPRCGEIMQDKAGTIQGNWQAKKEFMKDGSTSWSPFMGIGHNAHDPSIGVIGVAGTISDVGIIGFTPKHDGSINREPSEVTSDGKMYCYFHNQTPPWSGDPEFSGRILLQLIDDKTLKIEYQDKSCDESLNFISPTIYQR